MHNLQGLGSGPNATPDFADSLTRDELLDVLDSGRREPKRLPDTEAHVVTLADVQPESVSWLWPARIPYGKLTILDGDPGLGKSVATLDLAARMSVGASLPDGFAPEIGDTVLLTAEDGLADTVRPRFDAAGGDPARVHVLAAVGVMPVMLPEHLHSLRAVIEAQGARLVIVDPLMAFLSDTINSRVDQDVRRALMLFAQLADDTGAAVVLIRHLNKMTGGKALYRGGGSIGIVGAARSALLVGLDPDDETGQRRVMAVAKANLAPLASSLAFHLENGSGAARVVWDGESPHRADSLVRDDPDAAAEERDLRTVVRELLVAAGGSLLLEDLRARLQAAGLRPGDRTLSRVGNELQVKRNRGAFGGPVSWTLPGHTGHDSTHTRAPAGMPDALRRDGFARPLLQTGQTANTAIPATGVAGMVCGLGHKEFWVDDGGNKVCEVCHPRPRPVPVAKDLKSAVRPASRSAPEVSG